jgi:hypothetical protein
LLSTAVATFHLCFVKNKGDKSMTKTGIALAKKEIRQLIDKIPVSELNTAKRFLQYLVSLKGEVEKENPILKALKNAPLDDEPLTQEEIKALREADKAEAKGEIVSHEEARRILLRK